MTLTTQVRNMMQKILQIMFCLQFLILIKNLMFFEDQNACKLYIEIHFLPDRKTQSFSSRNCPFLPVWKNIPYAL
jgi:hypothetical protein